MSSPDWKWPVILLLVGAGIFLPALGQEGAVTDREARHAEIARTMLLSGDYLVPQLFGRPYIDKPPLFNWSVAALFRLTGRVDFTVARLPSALCSIAAMLGIYWLGRRWLSVRAGLCGALIWATSWLVVEWGRFCQMDVMMTALILYAILLADVAAERRGGWTFAAWLGACLLTAAATLSKGPPALFYFLVGAVCIWRARRGRWCPNLSLLLLLLIVTAAAWAAWLLPAEAEHPGHLTDLLHYQAGQGPTEHPARIWLYLDQILLRTAPWSVFAIGAAWWIIRRARRRFDLVAAPAFFVFVSLAVMTAVPNKREHYLLPVLPIWSLFIAAYLDRMLALLETAGSGQKRPPDGEPGEKRGLRLLLWPLRLSLALYAAAAVALAVYWVCSTGRDLPAGIFLCAAVLALALYGLAVSARAVPGRSLATLFSICVLVMATAYPLTLEVFNPPMPDLVELRRAAQAIPPAALGADLSVRSAYLSFKLDRPLTYLKDAQEASRFLDQPGPRYLLLPLPLVAEVKKNVTTRPLREEGPYSIGAKFPMTILQVK